MNSCYKPIVCMQTSGVGSQLVLLVWKIRSKVEFENPGLAEYGFK